MTIEEIVIREEGQTFDCKSIQISPKALAIPVVAFANADPEIAAFLKTYKYVKEFGEGVDRMSRELEANGTAPLSFHLDDFILKITVPRSSEVAEKVTENAPANAGVKGQGLIERLMDIAFLNGKKLSKNQIAILTLMIDNPYITEKELSKSIGIQETTVMRNIKVMRSKFLRRVGSDKSGFGEMIIDDRTEKATANRTETEQKRA